MARREQELIDQHRRWRAELDAMPEQPWEEPERSEVPPREQRLADARARRQDRVQGTTLGTEPAFFTHNGVTLVCGPAALMEQAWISGQPVRVKGSNGALYKVPLANITKPDNLGKVIGHPAGSLAARNRIAYLAQAERPKAQKAAKPRRNLRGGRRGARSR